MKYFSLVAHQGQSKPKTCAMVQASNLEDAARIARRLISSNILTYVDHGSSFFVRSSSRRETSLLQSFLASKTGDKISTYRKEDLDSLLYRRGGMLLSFFMALYLDPQKIKERFEPAPATGAPGGTGSGGVAVEQDTGIEGGGIEGASEESLSVESSDHPHEASVDLMPVEASQDDTVGSDNQIDALADIVNGGGDARDDGDMDPF